MANYHYYVDQTCEGCGETRKVRNDAKPNRCVACENKRPGRCPNRRKGARVINTTLNERTLRAWLRRGGEVRRYAQWGWRFVRGPEGKIGRVRDPVFRKVQKDLVPVGPQFPRNGAMMEMADA